MMLSMPIMADDSYVGHCRYSGRRHLSQIVKNYNLADSIVGYPHIGFFWGAYMVVCRKKIRFYYRQLFG